MSSQIRSTASQIKQDQAQQNRDQGKADGREWARTGNPAEIYQFLNSAGWWFSRSPREPWLSCPSILPDLKSKLAAKGKKYSLAFIEGVASEFQASKRSVEFVLHDAGLSDGQRWAAEFSTPEQLDRLRPILTDCNYRDFFIGNPRACDSSWTPAHDLTSLVLGDAYPVDAESDEMVSDCEEFRQFWQPFLAEPIELVMADLQRLDCCCKYKIQQQDYILGFIDGALGLSDQVKQRLSERVPTPAACELLNN